MAYARLSAPQGLQLNNTLLTESMLLSFSSGGGGGGSGGGIGSVANCLPPFGTLVVINSTPQCACAAGWSGADCATPAAGTIIYLVYSTCPVCITTQAACPQRWLPSRLALRAFTYIDGTCTPLQQWSQFLAAQAAAHTELATIVPTETAALTFNGSAWTVTCAAGAAGAPCTPPSYRLLAGSASATGLADGTGTAALFEFFGPPPEAWDDNTLAINSITSDGAGNYYLCETNAGTIRKITSAGVVTTLFTGNGSNPSGLCYTAPAPQNGLCAPQACVYSAGKLYIADIKQHAIWMFTIQTLTLTLFAGTPGTATYADGAAASAKFNFGAGGLTSNALAVASNGDLYAADAGNCVIRKISGGTVSTVAGSAGSCAYVDGAATATAQFGHPSGLAFDTVDATNAALYIIDGSSSKPQIRMLKNGNVSTPVPSSYTGIIATPVVSGYTGSSFSTSYVPPFQNRGQLTGIAVQNDQITVSDSFYSDGGFPNLPGCLLYRFGTGPAQRAVSLRDFFGLAPTTTLSASHLITVAANGALLPPYITTGTGYYGYGINAVASLSAFLLLPDGTLVGNLLFSYISNTTLGFAYSSQVIQATYAG